MDNKLIYSLYYDKYTDIGIEKTLKLIKNYDKNNNIAGIEINSYNLESLKYCAKFCKENNLIFKCHFPLKKMSEKETKDYLDCVNMIAKDLSYKVNIVFHSVNDKKNMEEKIKETKEYIKSIRKYISVSKLNVNPSLENLNYRNGVKRINVGEIYEVLNSFENLNFTFDIGHDLFDNKRVSTLSKVQQERLNNIHIHSILNNEDHHIIEENSPDLEEIEKGVKYLKNIGYTGDIVLEYSVDYLKGNTIEEKIEYYVKSFDFFKKLLENV